MVRCCRSTTEKQGGNDAVMDVLLLEHEARRMFRSNGKIVSMALQTFDFTPTERNSSNPRRLSECLTNQERRNIASYPIPCARMASTMAIKAAAMEVFAQAGITPIDYQEVEVVRTDDGLPFLSLSARLAELLCAAGIQRMLVSSTNDCGIALGVVAAVTNRPESSVGGGEPAGGTPLGIGVDLIFHATGERLFSDCTAPVLRQMFTEDEINEAFNRPNKALAAQHLLAAVSAKEAAFKSVAEVCKGKMGLESSIDLIEDFSFLDFEVLRLDIENPVVRLLNRVPVIVKKLGIHEIDVRVVTQDNFVGALALSKSDMRTA